jgi:hypothetical protein
MNTTEKFTPEQGARAGYNTHYVPMVLSEGQPAYLGARRAGVTSWFGTGLEQTTLFELTVA